MPAAVRLALWVCALVMSVAADARAQPAIALGDEIDPIVRTVATRDQFMVLMHVDTPVLGAGVAITGSHSPTLLVLDADGRAVGPEQLAPVGRILAVGRSTFLHSTLGLPHEIRRFPLSGGPSADVVPLTDYETAYRVRTVIAIGDDYVLVSSARIGFWPAGAPASEIVYTTYPWSFSCGGCSISSVACNAASCAVSWFDGSAYQIGEVDPRVGGSMPVPSVMSFPRSDVLFALSSGWAALVRTSALNDDLALTFYDGAWLEAGSIPAMRYEGLDCVGPDCIADRSADLVRLSPTGEQLLPVAVRGYGQTCTNRICVSPLPPPPSELPSELTAFDTMTLETVALPDVVWQSASPTWLRQLFWAGDRPIVRVSTTSDLSNNSPGIRAPVASPPEVGVDEPRSATMPGWVGGPLVLGWTGLSSTARLYDATFAPVVDVDLATWCPWGPSAGAWATDHWEVTCDTAAATNVVEIDSTGAATLQRVLTLLSFDPTYTTADGSGLYCDSYRAHCVLFGSTPSETRSDFGFSTPLAVARGRALFVDDHGRLHTEDIDGSHPSPPVAIGLSVRVYDISVTFDGTWFLVAWMEVVDSRLERVRLARIGLDGVSPDVAPLALTPFSQPCSLARRLQPALLSDGDGHTWIAYDRTIDDDLSYLVRRTRVRALSTGSRLGGGCVSSDDCASGVCARGVCCTNACDGACDVCASAEGALFDGVCTQAPGCSPDAGADAYVPDAGPAIRDAGQDARSVLWDGGVDGETAPDAAVWDEAAVDDVGASSRVAGGGCGCRASDDGQASAAPAVSMSLVLAWVVRRRRRASLLRPSRRVGGRRRSTHRS